MNTAVNNRFYSDPINQAITFWNAIEIKTHFRTCDWIYHSKNASSFSSSGNINLNKKKTKQATSKTTRLRSITKTKSLRISKMITLRAQILIFYIFRTDSLSWVLTAYYYNDDDGFSDSETSSEFGLDRLLDSESHSHVVSCGDFLHLRRKI